MRTGVGINWEKEPGVSCIIMSISEANSEVLLPAMFQVFMHELSQCSKA